MENQTVNKQNPLARVMGLRDFRLLFAGALTSLLGDQFALIATPWLVLQLTGDPAALGIVLALEGLPRAIFMLLGGAITDRLSPRKVMICADIIRFTLTVWLAVMIHLGIAEMWMVYLFALGFGLVAGFAIPAENSIVPMLVAKDDLQAGNSLMMGVTQLVGFVGPTIAGILIGSYSDSLTGVYLAFVLDAVSFAVSGLALWLITSSKARQAAQKETDETVLQSILAGIRYMWNDRTLRMMFTVLISINFFLIGPLQVGIPVLADSRLPEGALAFGILMSAFAGGNLVGFLLAGALPRPNGNLMRAIMIAVVGSFGLVVAVMGWINNTWVDFALLLAFGFGNGYVAIIMFTWMQTRTPAEMLGRMMSLVMFCGVGLVPISQAISGVLIKSSLGLLFSAAGLLVLGVTVWMALQPELIEFCSAMVKETEPVAEAIPAVGE